MFKRRTALAPEPSAPQPPGPGLVDRLREDGWVLPRLLTSRRFPAWTLVGTVSSPLAFPVDEAGLVSADGWALDWWVGADDRWHLPAAEPAIRQRLVDDAPVVETHLHIPGGDAVHRVYGFRSPRPGGDEWLAVEVENRTPVPFALALVIRPFVVDGVGAVGRITIEPVGGGRGRDVAHLVRVDGRPALVLPRRPARVAAGNRATGDAAAVVTSGEAGTTLVDATCEDGLATLALVFPVPHTALLRVVLPVGEEAEGFEGRPVDLPSVVPDAAAVASGWEIHRRGPRLVLPDARMTAAFERARAHLRLAHDGRVVRRDGRSSPDLEPGATELILGALDVLDHPAEVGAVAARWPDRPLPADPSVDALVLTTVARHCTLHDDPALLDWVMPEVAAAVERLDRADRRGQLVEPLARRRAVRALESTGRLLAAYDQIDGARSVTSLVERLGRTASADPPAELSPAAALELLAPDLASGEPGADDHLRALVLSASETSTFSGPGRGGRIVGQDLAADGALVLAVRSLIVDDVGDDLVLLPTFPSGWYGSGVEVHDLPTVHGRLSYAVRWHGARPALLWELEPRAGATSGVTLRIPGLDPGWSTRELRGDALLAEVEPPEGFDVVTVVAEHPDIDPVMRRASAEPTPPQEPLPDGGSFS